MSPRVAKSDKSTSTQVTQSANIRQRAVFQVRTSQWMAKSRYDHVMPEAPCPRPSMKMYTSTM